MTASSTSRSRLPRGVRIALYVVGGVIVLPLILIPIVAWAVDLGGLVKAEIEKMRPDLEKQIGRKLALGDVSVRLLPRIAVEVKDVTVQAQPGQTGDAALPLLQVGAMRVGVAAWPLLTSLGKSVEVSRIELDSPQVVVVRGKDGRLSYQDILDHLDSGDKPPSEPLTQEQLAYIQGVRLGRMAITNAKLRFRDEEASGAVVTIEQLDVVAQDVHLGDPLTVTMDAAVLAPARNLHFSVTTGPLPKDLAFDRPLALLHAAELKLQPIELQPLLRFLPAPPDGGVELARAKVDADLRVELPAAASKLAIQGGAGASGLVLSRLARRGGPAVFGQPADVRFKTDMQVDPAAGDVAAKLIEVTLNGMGVGGSADLHSLWTAPSVRSLSLASKNVTLEALVAILPPGTLPPKTNLRGPLELTAQGSGTPDKADVQLGLNLDNATIYTPELHKPAGVAMNAGFKGQLTPTGTTIERLGAVLGPLVLALHGRFQSATHMDLELDSGKVDIDPLLRLLPSVAEAVPAGQKLAGTLQVAGTIKRRGETTDASAQVALREANARSPSLELVGGAELAATVKAEPGSAAVNANLDLSAARIFMPGSIDKAAGVPIKLKLVASQAGKRVSLREARLSLPGGTIEATGQADTGAHTMAFAIPLADLNLTQLGKVLPAVKDSLPQAMGDGTLKFAMKMDGNPDEIGTAHVKVDQVDLHLAGTRMQGEAEVTGIDPLKRISFDFHGDRLELDKWLGGSSSSSSSPSKKSEPSSSSSSTELPPLLKTLEAAGKLAVASGRYKGVEFTDMQADLTLSKGKALFKVLKLSTFSGVVSASGTSVDFNSKKPRFGLRAKLENINLSQVVGTQSSLLAQKLEGRGTIDLNVDGAGFSWDQIAPALSGQLFMGLTEGQLKTPSLVGSALREVVTRVPGLAGQNLATNIKETSSLKDLAVRFAVEDGKLKTNKPIELANEEGSVKLNGNIGLDQSLALGGSMEIAPKALELVSAGRLKMGRPLPLDVKVGGTLTAPKVEVVNIEKTVAALAANLLQGQGKELLGGAIGKGLGGALGGQAAGAVGGAANALGQGNLDQAKQEAEKKLQEEAQKRLGEEAKKRLGGFGLPGGLLGGQGGQGTQPPPAPSNPQNPSAQPGQPAPAPGNLGEDGKKKLGEGLRGLFGH
ncbi:MAG TPA: AsmA family protein [Polyangia bacterium]|jgi:uncharacterized protein involved in outer membrane biogenesis|nr:AsmA family protein [Polyangia bacterium]